MIHQAVSSSASNEDRRIFLIIAQCIFFSFNLSVPRSDMVKELY